MNISDVSGRLRNYSGRASEIARYLGFAALAVFWIFSKDFILDPSKGSVPTLLIAMLTLVIFSFVTDILHYVVGIVIWQTFSSTLEKKHDVERTYEFKAPSTINVSTTTLFYAKMVLMLFAYSCLGIYFGSRIQLANYPLTSYLLFGYFLFVLVLLLIALYTIYIIKTGTLEPSDKEDGTIEIVRNAESFINKKNP